MLKQHMRYISSPLDLEITRMVISESNNWLETSRGTIATFAVNKK